MKLSINKSIIKQAVQKRMNEYCASDAMPGNGKKQKPMMQNDQLQEWQTASQCPGCGVKTAIYSIGKDKVCQNCGYIYDNGDYYQYKIGSDQQWDDIKDNILRKGKVVKMQQVKKLVKQAPRPVKPFVEQEDPVGMPDVGDPVDQAPGPMGGPVLSNEMLQNNELVKLVKDEVKYLYKEFVKRRRRKGVKKWSSGKQAAPIASPRLFNQIIEQAIEQGGVASPRYERLVDELLKVAQKREYQSKQGDADTWQTRRMGIEGQKGVKNLGKIGGQDTLKSKSKEQGPEDDQIDEPDDEDLARLAGLVPEQEQNVEEKKPEGVKK